MIYDRKTVICYGKEVMPVDRNEMIDRLREKADLSHEDAYNVLESVNWNFLDAVAALEKEGIIKEESNVIYSTKREESFDDRKINSGEEQSKFEKVCKAVTGMLEKGVRNNLHIRKNSLEIVNIPIIILVIFLCAAPVVVIVMLICAFFCGCSFSFSGEDLGKDKFNSFLEKIQSPSNEDKNE